MEVVASVVSGVSLGLSILALWRAGAWRRQDVAQAVQRLAEERERSRPILEKRLVGTKQTVSGTQHLLVTVALTNHGETSARNLQFGVRWRGETFPAAPIARRRRLTATALGPEEQLEWQARVPKRVVDEMHAHYIDPNRSLELWAAFDDPWGHRQEV